MVLGLPQECQTVKLQSTRTTLLAALVIVACFAISSVPVTSSSTPSHRLGFWIDERDMWSGVGLSWTPQGFVTNYFLTQPYPSVMLFATAMSPSGPHAPALGGALGEASWLSHVATLAASQAPKAQIVILFFVNLSGKTIDGVVDQTTLLTQFMSALGKHSNIYGVMYEREYFGNTVQEVSTFKKIVNNAGYANILDPTMASSFSSDQVLAYSTYPYLGGTIPSSTPYGSRSIGIGYGETGAPSGSTSNPAWTQSTVRAIVNSPPGSGYVIIYADDGGSGQPAWELWNWATLRQWIWTDPAYASSYILSNA